MVNERLTPNARNCRLNKFHKRI
nr:hypothetical protein SHINE37_90092 [Rhizobiaceae bacterium]